MSVVIFSFEGKNRLGGVATLCVELGTALSSAGYDVVFPLDAPRFTNGETRVVTKRQTQPIRNLIAAAVALRRAVGRNDSVVCSQWYTEGVLALLAGARPTVVLAYGSELMPSQARWRRPLWRWMRGLVFTRADTVICCSAYSRDLLLQSHPTVNAVALPLAVDHTRFTAGSVAKARSRFGIETDYVISTVSRLYEFKGHETVFRALAALPPKVRDRFTYLIAGTGPDQPMLAQKATDLGVDRHIRWLGYVSDEDLPLVYRASDLFILATRENAQRQEVEGFGLVFLEAQACGTPVVGTRTGGIPDAIEEGNGGWLIDQDDFATLGQLLIDLHDDPQRFREMGDRARRRVVTACTWEAYAKRFLAASKLPPPRGESTDPPLDSPPVHARLHFEKRR